MSKLPIDLKHFKKTAEDKHTTTLMHKDGHQLRISHNALHPEMQKALKALKLADGGMVEMSRGASESESEANQHRAQRQAADKDNYVDEYGNKHHVVGSPQPGVKIAPGYKADGGVIGNPKLEESKKVPHYAEGTPGGGVQAPEMPSVPQPESTQVDPTLQQKRSLYNSIVSGPQEPLDAKLGNPNADMQQAQQFGPNGEEPKNFNPQAWNKAEQNFNSQAAANAAQTGVQTAKTIEDNKARESAGLPPMPVPEAQPQAQSAGPANMPNPSLSQPQQPQDPYGMQQYAQTFTHGANMGVAGINNEATAIGQQGKVESQALGQSLQFQQDLMNHANQKMADNETEYNNFIHDIQNQHIDPSHYMKSLGVAGNIATGIGLILGGMGAGVTGGENPALSMLNKNIDRDIAAQQAELGKKENLLSANMKHFGNIRDATAMTQAMQAGIVINQLKQAEANAKDPIAKARAQQAAGQLYMDKVAPNLRTVAMNQTLMAGMQGTGNDTDKAAQMIQTYRLMGREQEAKALEERVIPGVGIAQVPVPREARDTIIAKQQLDRMGKDFYNWASQHSGSVNPSVVNEGKTKAAELQSLYRNSINGGVFKKGEQEFIDNIIDSDPTKFFNSIRVLPKLGEVIKNNQSQLDTLKNGYGLKNANQSKPSGSFQPKSFRPSK